MNLNEIPKQFITDFIDSIPNSTKKKIQESFNFQIILDSILSYYFDEDFDTAAEKKKLYYYYNRARKSWYQRAMSAIQNPNKPQKILGDLSVLFHSKVEKAESKSAQTRYELKLKKWAESDPFLACEFPFFENFTLNKKEKAVNSDLLSLLINFMDTHFSGNKEFIFHKSSDLILLSSVFGNGVTTSKIGKSIDLENAKILSNTESYYNKRVKIFTPEDAQLINGTYQLTFRQLLKGNEVNFDISDLTYLQYGNRWAKNKERVKDRLTLLNQYRVAKNFTTSDGLQVEQYITFIPEIEIVHTQDNKKIASLRYSDTLRDLFLNSIIIEEKSVNHISSSDNNISYLLNELLKKTRLDNPNVSEPFFEITWTLELLKDKFNLSPNISPTDIITALDELKENSDKLIDYQYISGSFNLRVKSLSSEEMNYMRRVRLSIDKKKNQFK